MDFKSVKCGSYIFNGELLCQVLRKQKNKVRFYVMNGAWEGILHLDNNTMEIDPDGWARIQNISLDDWKVVQPRGWSEIDQERWYYK